MPNSILRFPLPLSGLNTVNPYTDYDSGFARELTNYVILDGRLQVRPPVQSFAFNFSVVGAGVNTIRWFDPSTVTADSILSDGSVINYTTNTIIGGAGPGTVSFIVAQPHELKFSGTGTTLDLVIGMGRAAISRQPLTKASPFTPSGPEPSATMGIPAVAASHKGRIYYARGTRIEYGNIGQTSGPIPAANFVDIEQFLNGDSISRIFSVSLSPGAAPSQNLFVVFGSDTKVLVFEGDNPSSATWNLIADFLMPKPIGRAAYLEIDGDIFVATTRYAYWFRDLFVGGAQSAYSNSPSVPVENLWQAFTWISSGRESGHVWYNSSLDAIVCQCADKQILSQIFDYGNQAACLVYFRKYKAWALWGTTPFFHPIIANGSNLYGVGQNAALYQMIASMNEYRFDNFDFIDSGMPFFGSVRIESSWKTPYAFLDKGIGLSLKSARAWVEVLEFDSRASIEKCRAIFDYSDLNAPLGFYTQSNAPAQINPGRFTETAVTVQRVDSSQYNPVLQLGGDGGGVSMQISMGFPAGELPDPGYSDGYKYSIYALSALVQPGSEIF